jgi:hypothetical protein
MDAVWFQKSDVTLQHKQFVYEKHIKNEVEESGNALFEGTIPTFAWRAFKIWSS